MGICWLKVESSFYSVWLRPLINWREMVNCLHINCKYVIKVSNVVYSIKFVLHLSFAVGAHRWSHQDVSSGSLGFSSPSRNIGGSVLICAREPPANKSGWGQVELAAPHPGRTRRRNKVALDLRVARFSPSNENSLMTRITANTSSFHKDLSTQTPETNMPENFLCRRTNQTRSNGADV